jgi:lipopolysaccharide export system permease protein
MNTMDRYFVGKIVATLLRTLLAFALLYVLIDFLTSRQSRIDRYEIPWSIVLQYYASHVPAFIFRFQAVSLALLVATLFVLGKAAQSSEITALLAGGVSIGRIARAPIAVALVLFLGVFAFENTFGVDCAEMAREIDQKHFRRAQLDLGRGPSWTRLGEKNWSCHILRFNRVALTGTDVFMHAFNDDGMEEIRADRIYWDPDTNQWILEDGRWSTIWRGQDGGGEPGIAQRLSRKDGRRLTQMPAPFDETPDMLFALEQPADTKTIVDLYADLQDADKLGVPSTSARVAFHTKFSRPALCFVIVWLAIPFALRVRRGGIFLSFGLSLAMGLAYVTLYAMAIGLGNLELLPPIIAAWLANVVFLAVGITLFRRIPT